MPVILPSGETFYGASGGTTPVAPTTPPSPLVDAPIGSAERTQQLIKSSQDLIKQLAEAPPPSQNLAPGSTFQYGGQTYQVGAGGQPSLVKQPPGIANTGSLIGNVQIDALSQKLQGLSADISAGLASKGSTQILEGLFERFGVTKETTLLNDYNKQIVETQKRLQKLPEDIKITLQDVGVTENQLNRLIVKESQKPLETLKDLMEQKGAAQDRINQALKFVSIFSDVMLQDQAAKVEALKFDFETNKFMLGRLDEQQKTMVKTLLDEQKNKLSLIADLAKGGAPPNVRQEAMNLTSEEILRKYGNYLQPVYKPEAAAVEASPGFFDSKTESKVREDFVDIITNPQYVKNPQSLTDEEKTKAFNLLRQAYSPQQVKNEALQQLVGIVPGVSAQVAEAKERRLPAGQTGLLGIPPLPRIPVPSPLSEAGIKLPSFAEMQSAFFTNLFNNL